MTLQAWEVLQTPFGAACLGPIICVLLIPRLRKITWDVVETVLASLLLVALVLMVLGLPFGEWVAHCAAGAASQQWHQLHDESS